MGILNRNDHYRQIWADYVKSFAIFFMVLCHAGVGIRNPWLSTFIYAFHMPVFFMLSGFFEHTNGRNSIKYGVKKSAKQLIVPYFVFNIFGLTYCWYGMLNHPELNNNITAMQILPHGLLGMFTFQLRQTDFSFLPNGVLWFLMALFECKLIFMFSSLLYKKSKLGLSLYIFVLLIFSYIFISNRIELFVIGPTLLALPFYYVGYFLKKTDVLNKVSVDHHFVICIFSFIILCVLAPLNGRPDIVAVWFGNNIILFYLNALIGSLMCISFSKCLGNITFLGYLGKNTLSVLCLHVFFVMVGKRVIGLLTLFHSGSVVYCILVSLFSICFSLLCGAYISRRWPWMLGKFSINP